MMHQQKKYKINLKNSMLVIMMGVLIPVVPSFAGNTDILPLHASKSTITVGESVFARCRLKNRTETTCAIDCGNGLKINKRSGICQYDKPGQYTMTVTRVERRRPHSHTATVIVTPPGRIAKIRRRGVAPGAQPVTVETPVADSLVAVPKRLQVESDSQPNTVGVIESGPSVPLNFQTPNGNLNQNNTIGNSNQVGISNTNTNSFQVQLQTTGSNTNSTRQQDSFVSR